MRTGALIFVSALLVLTGFAARSSARRRPGVTPLPCQEALEIVVDHESRLACPDDPALAGCPHRRSGYRYDGCHEQGPMAGAVLLSRGQPISISDGRENDFAALTGIGPAIAAKITAARADRPLCHQGDLERISGIGPKKAQALSEHLRFDDARCAGVGGSEPP